MSTTPAAIRARLAHTARRISHLTRVTAALSILQRQRRKQLLAAASAKPVHPKPVTAMFDATTVSNIPAYAQAVAGYVGGAWPTFRALVAVFPHAHRLSIAVASNEDADCLDIEPGDSTPALAAAWIRRQYARGVKRPCLYCSVSSAQALVDLLAHEGLPRSAYRLWTAHYNYHEHICGPACGFGMKSTADATQWTDKALGRSLDQSRLGPGFFS